MEQPEYVQVEAEEKEQPQGSGIKVYVARCPNCYLAFGLSDYGKYTHHCGAAVEFVPKKAKPQ